MLISTVQTYMHNVVVSSMADGVLPFIFTHTVGVQCPTWCVASQLLGVSVHSCLSTAWFEQFLLQAFAVFVASCCKFHKCSWHGCNKCKPRQCKFFCTNLALHVHHMIKAWTIFTDSQLLFQHCLFRPHTFHMPVFTCIIVKFWDLAFRTCCNSVPDSCEDFFMVDDAEFWHTYIPFILPTPFWNIFFCQYFSCGSHISEYYFWLHAFSFCWLLFLKYACHLTILKWQPGIFLFFFFFCWAAIYPSAVASSHHDARDKCYLEVHLVLFN